MDIITNENSSKQDILTQVKQEIIKYNLHISDSNETKPWGAYYCLSDSDISKFIELYFHDIKSEIESDATLSPKILIVMPQARLSWQYHDRRSEIWKVIKGPIHAAISDSDGEVPPVEYSDNQIIKISCTQRHRLIGSGSWGIVAEIWQHAEKDNLSNEEDITRLQDDYGR